jgi:hypothetical protein
MSSRLPLFLILAASASLELLLNRIGVHLLGAERERALFPTLFKIVDHAGLFSFYLTGILALFVFAWAATVVIRDRQILGVVDRMGFAMLSALFLPIAAMGTVVTLPSQVAPHLNTAFVLLLLVIVVGFVRQPTSLRSKLGLVYLTSPLLLHAAWLAVQQIPSLTPGGAWSELPSQLFEAGEHLVVVGAFATFLFFAPFPRTRVLFAPLPLGISVVVTASAALFIRYAYPVAALCAYHGLGINIPPPSFQGLLHLTALFFFVLTLATLVLRTPPERASAGGLYLIAISGFHLQLPYQLVLTLLGVMQIGRAALEARRTAPSNEPSPEAWTAYLRRLASACARPAETGEAVVLHGKGQSVGQIRGTRDGLPFALRVVSQGSDLEKLEAQIGAPPEEPPPFSLLRTRGSRGRRVSAPPSEGTPLAVKIDGFERLFSVRGGSVDAQRFLSDPELRLGLENLVHGWLGLWPEKGVRYLAHPPPDGWPLPLAELTFSPADAPTEEIEALVALLSGLARRAGVGKAPTGR